MIYNVGVKEIELTQWVEFVGLSAGPINAMRGALAISWLGTSGETGKSTKRNQLFAASRACLGKGIGWNEFLVAGIKWGLLKVPGNCYKGGFSSECEYKIDIKLKEEDKGKDWFIETLAEYLDGGKTLKQATVETGVSYIDFRKELVRMKNKLGKELGLKRQRGREVSWFIKALAMTGRLRMTRNGEFRSTEAPC